MENFILLGTQRTGSSAIAKLINLHPHILCGLEWTLTINRKNKISTAKDLLSCNFSTLHGFNKEYVNQKFSKSLNWLGFKILFSSSNKWILHPRYSIPLWVDHLKGHLNWLKNNPEVHVIHIVRNDNLEWLKSIFLAKESKLYSGKKYPDGLKVQINIKNAISRIISKNWVDSCIQSLYNSNPYCLVTYEEFNSDNQKLAKKLVRFLGCDEIIDLSRFNAIKQSKGNARDYISNYDELSEELKQHDLLFANNAIL
jgi:hypothetical protein